MAMTAGPSAEGDVISAINTTPLVDVMLVLLIVFLITIPAVTASVPVSLPKERMEVQEAKPRTVIVSVDKGGSIYWFDAKLKDAQALSEKLRPLTAMNPQPEVQIRGDMDARYDSVGRILLECQRAGIAKVAFITQPPALDG
ncbi:ExbD/TolR family protein [Variovorax sp. AFSI2.2]|uniref:ExbD/TolR family protein n=1 Tax=Variovorax sp. AFSI2.2 TaxID=3384160 RepID=UPI003EBD8364